MNQFDEPLYVGIDIDAVEAAMDEADHHREQWRHAAVRRRAPQPNPWLGEFETGATVDAMIDPAALRPRGIPLA